MANDLADPTESDGPKSHTVDTSEKEFANQDVDAIVKKYDAESNFRNLKGFTAKITAVLCVLLSLFHVYTAGFGLLNEVMHRTVHLSFVLGLVFLVFPRRKPVRMGTAWGFGLCFAALYLFLAWQLTDRFQDDLPVWGAPALILMVLFLAITALPVAFLKGKGDRLSFADWPLAIAAAGISLYLIIFFKQIFIENIGFPQTEEYVMGLLAIIMVTEACRRVMGETLPVIGALALMYGLLGPWLPGVLAHRGYDIVRIVEHLYLGTEGIYGIAVGVVATYVFHFVLFGVLAQASGLGQLFIDLAMILAGRYSGGPAKVAVVSSGFFGMISGSPIANTATTGSFTIPMMKRNGFSAQFASAVEASASCGGQVTPPIMFVYAPSMLFIDFSWAEFSIAMTSGILGIVSLSAAYIGFFKNEVGLMGKIALTIGGLLLVSSSATVILVGAVSVLLILVPNVLKTGQSIPAST